jgi:hypothetical protein
MCSEALIGSKRQSTAPHRAKRQRDMRSTTLACAHTCRRRRTCTHTFPATLTPTLQRTHPIPTTQQRQAPIHRGMRSLRRAMVVRWRRAMVARRRRAMGTCRLAQRTRRMRRPRSSPWSSTTTEAARRSPLPALVSAVLRGMMSHGVQHRGAGGVAMPAVNTNMMQHSERLLAALCDARSRLEDVVRAMHRMPLPSLMAAGTGSATTGASTAGGATTATATSGAGGASTATAGGAATPDAAVPPPRAPPAPLRQA